MGEIPYLQDPQERREPGQKQKDSHPKCTGVSKAEKNKAKRKERERETPFVQPALGENAESRGQGAGEWWAVSQLRCCRPLPTALPPQPLVLSTLDCCGRFPEAQPPATAPPSKLMLSPPLTVPQWLPTAFAEVPAPLASLGLQPILHLPRPTSPG